MTGIEETVEDRKVSFPKKLAIDEIDSLLTYISGNLNGEVHYRAIYDSAFYHNICEEKTPEKVIKTTEFVVGKGRIDSNENNSVSERFDLIPYREDYLSVSALVFTSALDRPQDRELRDKVRGLVNKFFSGVRVGEVDNKECEHSAHGYLSPD